jgi:hypothetical protein
MLVLDEPAVMAADDHPAPAPPAAPSPLGVHHAEARGVPDGLTTPATGGRITIGQHVPGVDTGSREFRNAVAPLNRPSEEVSPEVRAAAEQASTEAFHLAMLVAAGLMMAGAAVNGFGIRNPAPAGRHLGPGAEQPPPESGSGTPSDPAQVGAEEFRAGAA